MVVCNISPWFKGGPFNQIRLFNGNLGAMINTLENQLSVLLLRPALPSTLTAGRLMEDLQCA
jgi:hypothetical protein